MCSRLGGCREQSGLAKKISPPLGFDSWSVQPVVSRYTNYAIHATGQDDKAGKIKEWSATLEDLQLMP